MTFDEVLEQVRELLQSKGRVSYRALKLQFNLDDDYLEGLKDELIAAERVAADEDGKVLVWVGRDTEGEKAKRRKGEKEKDSGLRTSDSGLNSAERRQLTVMFCDLVGSTALSAQLDPEELREVVRAYQETCTEAIRRYDGHIAQHLGDGLLVYFGYPAAHEDDAQRAVRAGLEIVAALQKQVPSSLAGEPRFSPSPVSTGEGRGEGRLQVRIGIHTGLVVIGEIGSSEKREILALGETPNIAARLQGLAEPDTLVISAATQRLIQGLFACQDLGPQELKGITTPIAVYQVLGESGVQSRFEVAVQAGLTPLVGRDEELALLHRRWRQAHDGEGQVVLVSGEPGIGKSRLVQELKNDVLQEGAMRIEFRCSPYHQNSALSPLIEHVQRVLHFAPGDTPQEKLRKLAQTLGRYRFPQADTVPLLAALLSLPQPAGLPPLTLSPQQQKQKTLDALVRWLFEEAERATVYTVWEDLHWADPSTLEFLAVCLDQVPTARMLKVLTFRPEFTPVWASRSYLIPLTLNRLGRGQIHEIVRHVAAQISRPSTKPVLSLSKDSGRTKSMSNGETSTVRAEPVEARTSLPDDLVNAIVARTDGVPLFVEELTKSVIESVESIESIESIGSRGGHGQSPLPLGIPTTLRDALMARLDRLGAAKEIAQVGAVLGREFSYELLSAVSSGDEDTFQYGLRQLVAAELVYQSGLPPQARYLFKHALVQETAYQSLLKSRRQQVHQHIAQVLEGQFPDTVETQPELLAHHYTEAGLIIQALPYWQQAGQKATKRSAYAEAISHLSKGLELTKTLPDTPERAQHELAVQVAIGATLMVTKGYGALEVEQTYARARELCRQVGETPQLFPVLWALWAFYLLRAEYRTAHELGKQLFALVHSTPDSAFLVEANVALGATLFWMGEMAPARTHLEQGAALYNHQQHRSDPLLYGFDQGGLCLSYLAWALWHLGYPDQALQRTRELLTLTSELAHPFSMSMGLDHAAWLHQRRREWQTTQELAERAVALSTEQEFPFWAAEGTILRGWALTMQKQIEDGIAQMRQGLAAWQATGEELARTNWLAFLAEAHGKQGQSQEGLVIVGEALEMVEKTEERFYEAELYRLKGWLTLQSQVKSHKSKVEETEACFLKAIEIAQRQQAKSLELRAVMSLAKLWQQQGKQKEAHGMLSEIYGWFTEGFDTKDLQEAKALLEELAS